MSAMVPRLDLEFRQDRELKQDDPELLQAKATMAGLYDMEINLRRDGFNAVAACIALARLEIMELIDPRGRK